LCWPILAWYREARGAVAKKILEAGETRMNVEIGRTTELKFVLEEVTDPVQNEEARVQFERAKRNSDWLQQHWGDLLPGALGKFVAVAGQEAFIADTGEQAWAWATRVLPEDNGALVQYVRPTRGPRIYANRR
jgi:hypothetical protein